MKRTLFALVAAATLGLALFAPTPVRAAQARESQLQKLALEVSNLETVADADEFARAYLEKHGKERLLLLHVGRELPLQLKWIALHFERAHLPFEVKLVTPGEIASELDGAEAQATELLTYDQQAGTVAKTRTVASRARLLARQLFGLPNGLTFWVRIKSDARQKWIEAGSAAFQSVQAGVSLGVSLYLVQKSGTPLSIAPAVGVLTTWVWANSYKLRPIVEVMTQGRALKQTAPGKFEVKESRLFFYLASAMRNFLLNGLIVGAAFGWDQPLTHASLATNFENVGLSLVAGTWVEQYINSRQARASSGGVREAGKWSPAKTIVINTLWATFYYGIVRNLHLLNYGSFGKYTYYALAAVGTVYTVFEERLWLAERARALGRALGIIRRERCETLLVRR